MPGKTLKLCTFKIKNDYSGNRYGELLLKAVFDHAEVNNYQHLYFTAFPKYENLIVFAESFGFIVSKSLNARGENIVYKYLTFSQNEIESLSSFEAHIRFGPRKVFFHNNASFIIPIQPQYHRALFPELETQKLLFQIPKPCGNSIKKAYLCHSNTKQLKPGDNIFFYRSHDISGITAIGVVEESLRTSNVDEIARYVGTRTVYSYDDIENLCKKMTLAIKFRFVKGLNQIPLKELKKNEIIKGAPQSITKIPKERVQWIKEKIGM